jgi:hypothetical protein
VAGFRSPEIRVGSGWRVGAGVSGPGLIPRPASAAVVGTRGAHVRPRGGVGGGREVSGGSWAQIKYEMQAVLPCRQPRQH